MERLSNRLLVKYSIVESTTKKTGNSNPRPKHDKSSSQFLEDMSAPQSPPSHKSKTRKSSKSHSKPKG